MRLPLPDALRVRHQSAFATHQSAASCSAAVAGLRVSDYRAGHRRSRSGVPGRSIGGGHRPHPIFQPSNGEGHRIWSPENSDRFSAGIARRSRRDRLDGRLRRRARTSPRRTSQRHAAEYHGKLRTVHYRFRPRAGDQVEVVGGRGFNGRKYLMVLQSDRTLACLPEWMTCPRAGEFVVRDVPVLPRQTLSGLRAVVDEFFLSESEPMNGGCGNATTKYDGARRAGRTGQCLDHDHRGPEQRDHLIAFTTAAACRFE